jgi:hypothetical protein
MTPSPALTWRYLLPSETVYDCRSGPPWLRESLPDRGGPGDGRVAVEWGSSQRDIASFESAAGFVGINCKGISAKALASAGFSHVRRFAVLPSLDHPRWFIPLEAAAVSSAAFNLYTPARLSARLIRSAARALASMHLPIWYRDQIVIAQRQPSPLESAAQRWFPGASLFVALSAGAPEGARNRKASAAIIDASGKLLAFLKIADSGLSRHLQQNEAAMLRALPEAASRLSLPRLIAAEEIDGVFVTAQTPLPGRPAPVEFGPSHRRLLDCFCADRADIPANTDLVRELGARIAALSPPRPELAEAMESISPLLRRHSMPVGIMHGDFAPWNLRQHRGQTAAFDWEYGLLNGPAGLDEIHYRLQVGFLMRNWSVEHAATELYRGEVLQNCPRSLKAAMITLYLVDMLARLFAEGYDGSNQMVNWTLRLLARLSSRVPGELALT